MTPPKTIFLVGLPGAGKTHFGRYLAARINFQFRDLDQIIESETERKIDDIFRDSGEAHFRMLEKRYLRSCPWDLTVLATGGGTPCFHGNMDWMKAHGRILFLDPPREIILQRLKNQFHRPLISAGQALNIDALDAERRDIYEQADFCLKGEKVEDLYQGLLHLSLFH